ncbi:uncharacterized protein LOC133424818 [Cololabis saira]|uniref:uncharacterized protein LOC133424818 n=1 Tax=Cololabis saira TaxID=129043 RepID=UPI002AD4C0CB|nr:uncharacterized protein LOC133424818 [Cololabis saira]
MAERSAACEAERLEQQLQGLLGRCSEGTLPAHDDTFCRDFCQLVEEHASRWQMPLPQLRILETALHYFARASTFFASNCDQVQHAISSLALSLFELLLFFDQKDFDQEPLKHFTATFQECHLVLSKYQNVHMLQVERLVHGGGPWASPTLQAVLSESCLPHTEVEGYISSELPVFFELRVRYLLSCDRAREAMALAKCCTQHPTTGLHLFFLQVYLTWLHKTSQFDHLRKEVADINGKDAVQIICSLECEEKDDLLLALSTAFLSQQLRRGDMYHLCDLVSVWANLHHRLNTSKQALLKECQQLMSSATNIKSIFPFIRAILQEAGEEGIQFCIEVCADALQSRLPCDVMTKTFIYKTIAGLLPGDLEVCRACALLIFFLERTVESYKMVYLLYVHPDQDYHVDDSPLPNHVRFETLQILKKDLHFDPEFWNLIALRTNCLSLMSGKVVSAALLEIMEDKWLSKYCAKDPALRSSASACHGGELTQAKKRHHKEDKHFIEVTDDTSKRLKLGAGKTRLNDHTVRRKGNQRSQPLKESSSGPLRRSFWQLDRIHGNVSLRYEEHKRTTRHSEKNPPKRKIRQPKWLLEDSGTLEENVPMRIKKNSFKKRKRLKSCVMKRSERGQMKNNAKLKPLVSCHLKARENKYQNGFSLDITKPASPPQVILELSLPDNELIASFSDDSCTRPKGLPQVLLYKPTVKPPASPQPAKTVHRKEVVLRARDLTMFIQQLHCYVRRQKGKGTRTNVHGSVSTITRSSVQGSPPKDSPKGLCGKTSAHMKRWNASQTAKDVGSQVSEKVLQAQNTKVLPRKTSTAELTEKSAVETGAEHVTESPHSDWLSKKISQSITCLRDLPESSAEVEVVTTPPTSEAAEGTKVSDLRDVPEAHRAAAAEPREEPAVEMKVTIASQSSVLDKVSKPPSGEDVSQTSATAVKTKMEPFNENHSHSVNANVSNCGAADHISSHGQDFDVSGGEQHTRSSQGESGKDFSTHTTEISHVQRKSNLERNPTLQEQFEPEAYENPTALTLVTEMVTEISPKQLAQDQETDKWPTPDIKDSTESRGGSLSQSPSKGPTDASAVPEQEPSLAHKIKEEDLSQDTYSDTSENGEPTGPETEESRLEYYCTFCTKDFKGSRVVSHAMFHYRKDECMFCRVMFKDDLLAMIHLSDHIEKLKRSKEDPAGRTPQENGGLDTKDTPAKANTMSSPCRKRGRRRKSAVCPKTESSHGLASPESRTDLRSNDKQKSGTSSHKNQNASKHLNAKAAVHRVNGHFGKKEFTRLKKDVDVKQEHVQQKIHLGGSDAAGRLSLQENQDVDVDSSASSHQAEKEVTYSVEKKNTESHQVPNKASKQIGRVVEEKNVPQKKISCPVDGCSWLSKNQVAVLCHALESHGGEIKPLELAFRVGNGQCSICKRVLRSFEHFQHHVERHRDAPRHPCLHQGCTARFKSGMEMSRHARKHSPLQAMCCLPGCSQLFICLWALNLHEREHYASKSHKNEKNTSDKVGKTTVQKKCPNSEDTTASTSGNRTEGVKAAHKLKDLASHDSPSRKKGNSHPFSGSKASEMKEPKERDEHNDSDALKSLSTSSAQPTVPGLWLRQTLRKATIANLTAKTQQSTSSLSLKQRKKVGCMLKKNHVKGSVQGFKRRGRPPKLNKVVHDENTSAGPKRFPAETQTISTVSTKSKVEKEKCTKVVKGSVQGFKRRGRPPKLNKAVHDENNSAGPKRFPAETPRISTVSATKSKVEKEKSTKVAKGSVQGFKRKGRPPKLNKAVHDENTSAGPKRFPAETQRISTVSAKLKVEKEKSTKVQNEAKTEKATDNSDSKLAEERQGARGRAHNKSPSNSLNQTISAESKTQKSSAVKIKKLPKIKSHHTPSNASKLKKLKSATRHVNKSFKKKEVPTASKKVEKSKSAVPQVKAKAGPGKSSADAEGNAKVENSTQIDSSSSVPSIPAEGSNVPRTAEDVQKGKRGRKPTKSLHAKDGNKKASSSGPSKTKKIRLMTEADKKSVKEKCLSKKQSKASALKKDAKSKREVQQQGTSKLELVLPKSTPDEEKKEKEPSDAVLDSSCPSRPAEILSETGLSNKDDQQKVIKKEKSKKSDGTKKSEVSKASAKRKNINKDDTNKSVKKKSKDHGHHSSLNAGTTLAGTTLAGTTLAGTSLCGSLENVNGQVSTEDVKFTLCKETLAEYGKKPYMRLPPTAYLDEKYITMPKRRKEMSFFQLPPEGAPLEQASVAAALQRQRCGNCFATFSNTEELQGHQQRQSCSKLFGFDSDDEGNS